MSTGLWTNVSGVARKLKKVYVASDGVNRKLKRIFAARDGVNRKIFSGYDCQANNIGSLLSINAAGAMTGDFSASSGGWNWGFALIFPEPITFLSGTEIAVIDYEICTNNYMVWLSAGDGTNPIADSKKDVNAKQFRFVARNTGTLTTFYFSCRYQKGKVTFSTPNAAITFMGQKLTSIEII